MQAKVRAEAALLSCWSELMKPSCVTIDDIATANCAPPVQAGTDFFAVVSAVRNHSDGPEEGVRELCAAIVAGG